MGVFSSLALLDLNYQRFICQFELFCSVSDSFFLANGMIDLYANSDFARLAINWLLERPQLLEGISSQPVTEFRIAMTGRQLQTVRWTLLAAMPGGILALAGLVWLRRRK